ncbi:hypothetical protein CPB97_001700 [Podila verticillata]|nr:hypothetical protein CPB97_001700 [Podila verticillata]
MVAYAAALFPKLVDVSITCLNLNLEVGSGFCFLSKPENLKWLQVRIGSADHVLEQNLWWVSSPNMLKNWSQQHVAWKLFKMQASKEAKLPAPHIYDDVPTIEDVRGYLLDPKNVTTDRLVESYHLSSALDLLESFMCADEAGQQKTS